MTGKLLLDAHRHLSAAHTIKRSGFGPFNMKRLKASLLHEGAQIAVIADISPSNLILVSVHEDRPDGKRLNREAQAKVRKARAMAKRKG